MSSKLSGLYHKCILRHNDHPVNYEKREDADYVIEAYNPLCGDRFTLYLDIADGRVAEAHFFGYGCAVSKASTSVLVKKIRKLSLGEIEKLCEQFYSVVGQESAELPAQADKELEAFAAAREFPGRLKCATLSWDELVVFCTKGTHFSL